jgi:hypothetical protein
MIPKWEVHHQWHCNSLRLFQCFFYALPENENKRFIIANLLLLAFLFRKGIKKAFMLRMKAIGGAESEGFEPSVRFHVRMFSKHVLSASQATLRVSGLQM